MSPASTSLERRASVEPSVVVKHVNGRRMVSRTNPEISYAYGAPASGKEPRKRRLTQDRSGAEAEDEEALDDNADASTSAAPDAKARYQALKKRKVQEAQQINSSTAKEEKSSTRRSPRKTLNGSLVSGLMAREHSQASQEGRRSAAGAGSVSDDLSSNARMQRISSPGRSRGFVHGQLNSFYMDRDDDAEDDVILESGKEHVPSSILVGAQRQGHDLILGGRTTEMDSIHSSDLHDSGVRDFAELQKEADMLADGEESKGFAKLSGTRPHRQARGVHAVDAAVAALNGIAEESDGEHSATEGRKHTQRSDVHNLPTRKQFRSPPRPTTNKAPVPIRRHSARRLPISPLAAMALLGVLVALALSMRRGAFLDAVTSVFPSDATIGDAALRKRIQLLENRLGAAEKHVNVFEGQITSAKRLSDQVTETGKSLLSELAALQSKEKNSGAVNSKTIEELKQIFALKGDKDGVDAKGHSWDAFREANDAALRKLSAEVIARERQDGSIVSEDALHKFLAKEMDSLKVSLEMRFNANAQEMQNEILAKIRQQQEMFERAGSWKKGDGAGRKAVEDLGNARESLQQLIDDALEVFAADRIGERDYALYTAGGRIVPSLTSRSYSLDRSGSSVPLLGWLRGRSGSVDRIAGEGQPPVIAIVPDNTPGMCWAFEGKQGTLGVSLSRRIVVDRITLEHTPASISHERGSSAPRDVTVWGLVERITDVRRLQAYRAQQQVDGAEAVSPTPAPPSDRHVLLSSFTYDVSASRAVQSFPVSREAQRLQLPVNVVQVHVHSNHGKEEFTCLYRVRVHGREWTLEDEASSEAAA